MYSTQEKDAVLQHLRKSREALISAVSGLSEAQSNFKPAPDAWSIADIVEHLAIVEDLVAMRLDQIGSAPNAPEEQKFKDPDAVLLAKVMDRSSKFKTPERGQPTGRSLTESLDRLTARRKNIVEFVQSAPADFRQHTMPHPVLGPLDGHQWLLSLAGHCARHTQQVMETKAAPTFPSA